MIYKSLTQGILTLTLITLLAPACGPDLNARDRAAKAREKQEADIVAAKVAKEGALDGTWTEVSRTCGSSVFPVTADLILNQGKGTLSETIALKDGLCKVSYDVIAGYYPEKNKAHLIFSAPHYDPPACGETGVDASEFDVNFTQTDTELSVSTRDESSCPNENYILKFKK